MKISELKDKQKDVNIDLKIIYDKMPEKEIWGRRSKTIVVADIESKQGDETALLDLFDADIDKYKFGDKIRAVSCYAKKITTKRGEQFLITYGYHNKELVGRYEKIEVQ